MSGEPTITETDLEAFWPLDEHISGTLAEAFLATANYRGVLGPVLPALAREMITVFLVAESGEVMVAR